MINTMNVIIPVAGEGTRLRPHTHLLPKSLLYVAGKPILGHILDRFQHIEVDKFVLVLGAKGEAIQKFCNGYPYKFRFTHQKRRLGLGHAVYTGAVGLKGATVVWLGDTIIDFDIKDFYRYDCSVLAVREVEDPERFGIVETKGDEVIDLREKPRAPRSNLAIIGLYYFHRIELVYDAVKYIMKKGIKTKDEYQLTDALKYLLEKGEKFRIVKIAGWFDCGTAQSLLETNRHLLKKNHHYKKRKNCVIYPPVYIADSALIKNSIIGPNVSIGENALVEGTIIADSIVNSSAILKNVRLKESIIGENALVKGGFKKLNVGDSSVIEFP